MSRILNFIDGELRPPVDGKYLDNVEPATGKVYSHCPDSSSADVELAVAAAAAAFPSWSTTPRTVRASFLTRIADSIESRLAEFALAESTDQGKPVSLATAVDIPRAVANFRYFAGRLAYDEDKVSRIDGVAWTYTHHQPVGVAGLISPWNLPLYLLTWKIAPAIAYGCTCVCKPSEVTPMTAFLLADVLIKVGLPKGVVNIVFGTGPGAGEPLVLHPNVPLISFTGSTTIGTRISALTSPFPKKLSLELGGKNATIVFADADLPRAAEGAVRAAFANQGEVCLCGSRVLVQSEVYDAFLALFLTHTRALTVGDPRHPSTTTGALVSRAHYDKVVSYLALAVQEGGKVVHGGRYGAEVVKGRPVMVEQREKGERRLEGGFWMEPTVVVGLGEVARCNQEEIFGPVVTILPFRTEEDALRIANGTKYGLSASVWSEDLRRAHRVAEGIRGGYVWVNCWMVRDLNAPFGGTKASGIGREGGAEWSREFYCDTKAICVAY
ncbi:2-aminomuconic semialdehyde dehydrogenase [Gonapodya prolifera JEL478]|uniref:2-aminomuconic semialdehyde dehydrogenase n=1 Tax=Gonapodya prolifera (strain JEL478) TaxID=1344416 RepID=A0A138ZX82_GONPJ|nr:2-aminomuconic semialdehyde dehydrogenase [Gonapodya prolifera JEL478]|eukprot:KXS09051.1 2-aminomuconic semialdehyde dehydrogenase [Gonapodya prolifera JEL478]